MILQSMPRVGVLDLAMAAQIVVKEDEREIIISSLQRHSFGKAFLAAAITMAGIFLIFRSLLPDSVACLLAIGCGILAAASAWGARKAELRVNSYEFKMKGTYGRNGTASSVAVSSVLGFEYLRQSEEGEEFSDYPGGLYCLVDTKYICLLPYVDRAQCVDIVERLRTKFAAMRYLRMASDYDPFAPLGL
jgi:hypothetical protein